MRMTCWAICCSWLIIAMPVNSAPRNGETVPAPLELDPELAAYVKQAQEHLRTNPDDGAMRAKLAMILDANGLSSAAREQYLELTRREQNEARWWFHLARMEVEAGDLDAAIAAIDKAIAAAPDRAELRWRRGLWLLDVGRLNEAEITCRGALSLDPGSEPAKVALSKALLQEDKPDEAVKLLENVLVTSPDHGYARQLLGVGYRAQGRLDEARAEAERSAGARPRWADSWDAELGRFVLGHRAVMQRAQALMQAGRPREAVPLLERASAQRPDDVSVLLTLCAAYAGINRYDLAGKVLAEAPPSIADHFAVHLNLSKVHLQTGNLAAARAEAQRAVERGSLEPAVHLQLAQVLMMQGDASGAWQSWEKAKSLRPDDPAVNAVRPLLQQLELQQKRPAGAP